KSDEADVEGMCLLLRLGKLKEVWMGTDRTREIYRALVYELLNWRDAQRQLKALIKARYRQWGVLKLHGLKVFSKTWRQQYLPQLPGEEERRMILRLYAQHDHAVAQWKETLKEVERVGKAFYHQNRQRTGSVRHARLNTQRKILESMWLMWLRQKRFEPEKFALKTDYSSG